MSDWQVENLRLTAFVVRPSVPKSGYWQELVGKAPSEMKKSTQQQMITEVGSYSPIDEPLSVEVKNDRIDWRLFCDQTNPSSKLPTVGPYAPLKRISPI